MKEREGKSFTDLLRDKGFGFDSSSFKNIKDMSKSREEDGRFWKVKFDDTGNSYSVLRFFPDFKSPVEPEEKAKNVLLWYRHFFKTPSGSYLVEPCPTIYGRESKCPICEDNSVLWKTEIAANQNIARNRKRKLSRFTNVYIIKDTLQPENNGKVFIWDIPYEVFDLVSDRMSGKNPHLETFNVFNPIASADLKLIVGQKEVTINNKTVKVPSFTNTNFSDTIGPMGDDDMINKVAGDTHALALLLEEEKFKPKDYASLKRVYVDAMKSSSSVMIDGSDETPQQETTPEFKSMETAKAEMESKKEPEEKIDNKVDANLEKMKQIEEELKKRKTVADEAKREKMKAEAEKMEKEVTEPNKEMEKEIEEKIKDETSEKKEEKPFDVSSLWDD